MGNDIVGDKEGGGPGRSVIRPPMQVDPGIQGTVPEPSPNTTPLSICATTVSGLTTCPQSTAHTTLCTRTSPSVPTETSATCAI